MEPAHRHPVAPTGLVDPSTKDKPSRLEFEIGLRAHSNQERQANNHKESHEAYAHEVVKQW